MKCGKNEIINYYVNLNKAYVHTISDYPNSLSNSINKLISQALSTNHQLCNYSKKSVEREREKELERETQQWLHKPLPSKL